MRMTNIDLHQPVNGQFLEFRCERCDSNLFKDSATGETYCPNILCNTTSLFWYGVIGAVLLVLFVMVGSCQIAKNENESMAERIKSYQSIKK